jgi:hypothetical protein
VAYLNTSPSHSFGEVEGNRRRDSSHPDKIRTGYLLSTSLKRYSYTNLLGRKLSDTDDGSWRCMMYEVSASGFGPHLVKLQLQINTCSGCLLRYFKVTPSGNFPLHYRIQTGSEADPASSFPEGKAAGPSADHPPPSSGEVKNAWSYTSVPLIRLYGVVLR